MGTKAEVGLALVGVQICGVCATVPATFQTLGERSREHPEVRRRDSGQQSHLRGRHVPAAFHGQGIRGRILARFLKSVGQLPMDRSGGRASGTSMEGVLGVLRSGDLLGIYPEGTRSPDGRLYKGKTGVARLVLQAGVPVVPVAMIDTELVPSRFFKIPTMRRPKIKIGKPMDFSAYAAAGNDRDVLRWITNEIMNAVMELSGQEYVDVYGTVAKTALEEGRELPASAGHPPGAGRAVPPIPIRPAALDVPPVSDVNA